MPINVIVTLDILAKTVNLITVLIERVLKMVRVVMELTPTHVSVMLVIQDMIVNTLTVIQTNVKMVQRVQMVIQAIHVNVNLDLLEIIVKHVTFAMATIATVMETAETTKMAILVNVYQNTMDKTVKIEITATVTHAHLESVQILTMVSIVPVKADTRVLPVMQ